MMPTPHVRLAMLARDEAPRIAEVADALGSLVDDVVVLLDDRSTDETEAALEHAFPGRNRVESHTFVDFASARNRLFAAARRRAPKGAWLLLADPDSPPRGSLPDPLDRPGSDAWACTWRSGAIEWSLPILVRADVDCRYEGAAHELLVGHSPAFTDALRVDVPAKPVNPERQELYVELLSRDAATNPRSAFYLARTLAELGRSGAAIEAYLRRAQMGNGWVEETYYCLVEAGRLLLPLDVELAETLLRRARSFRPSRIEPLYWLAWLANWRGEHGVAYGLAAEGLGMPHSRDSLFVDRWVEREGLAEEMDKAMKASAMLPTRMETAHGESLR